MSPKLNKSDAKWRYPLICAERAQFAELWTGWNERFQIELLKKDAELVSIHKKLDNKSNYKRRDLSLLLGTDGNRPSSGWISDETVNEYMGWICRFGNIQAQRVRSTVKHGVTERFLTINSLAVTSLFDTTSPLYKGPEGMTRTLKRLNCEGELLLRPEFIFLPIQKHESHWILGAIIPGQRMIAVLDSLRYNENMEVAVVIDDMIRYELGDRYDHRDNGEPYENPDWVLYDRTGPAQSNGSDCGVHMLTNAMCMIMGWGMTYEAKDIPAKRRRIAAELMSGFEQDGELGSLLYLQRNGNSIAPGISNPKYPLARGDAATDAEIEGQNQRTDEHIHEFTNENSKLITRDDVEPIPQPVKSSVSVVKPTGQGMLQDLPISIDLDTESGSSTPVNTGLSAPLGRGYQGLFLPTDLAPFRTHHDAFTPEDAPNYFRKDLFEHRTVLHGHGEAGVTKTSPDITSQSTSMLTPASGSPKIPARSNKFYKPLRSMGVSRAQPSQKTLGELPSEGNVQTQPPSEDFQASQERLRKMVESQLKIKIMPQDSVINPPELLWHTVQPTPYKNRKALVAAVESCDHKRALREVCRAHGWDICDYYAWGDFGVSLEDYKLRVKEEDAKIRSEDSLF